MSALIPLEAEARDKTGKGEARSVRRSGKIPAIIYGKGKEVLHIALQEREITNYYKKANFNSMLFDIMVGGKKYHALPRAVQLHPVTDNIEHVDFIHVSENSEVKVVIHLHFSNEDKAPGIKRGGILSIINREITVVCHPSAIPGTIDIDVSSLEIGHSIHLNDLVLPKGVKPAVARNLTIATIVGRISEDEKAATTAETGGATTAATPAASTGAAKSGGSK